MNMVQLLVDDHTPAEAWSYDDENHWRACTKSSTCTERLGEEAHSYTDGVCKCGKEEA